MITAKSPYINWKNIPGGQSGGQNQNRCKINPFKRKAEGVKPSVFS